MIQWSALQDEREGIEQSLHNADLRRRLLQPPLVNTGSGSSEQTLFALYQPLIKNRAKYTVALARNPMCLIGYNQIKMSNFIISLGLSNQRRRLICREDNLIVVLCQEFSNFLHIA